METDFNLEVPLMQEVGLNLEQSNQCVSVVNNNCEAVFCRAWLDMVIAEVFNGN
jgi:hypothetical protein